MYIEYSGPDQTVLSYKVNKGEIIVESGHRVSDKASRILEEIARREGVGNRTYAYLGLTLLILLLFYVFYLDIKRYRASLVADSRKMFLLAFLLLITVIVSQFTKFVLSLVARQTAARYDYDRVRPAGLRGSHAGLPPFRLPSRARFFVRRQHPARVFLFQGDPFMPVYYFLGSIVAALSVIHCKKRTAVLRAGALTGLVNIVSIVGNRSL